MPPPTGVVSGPLIATLYALTASSVSLGSHSPTRFFAFSPASTLVPDDAAFAAERFRHRGVEDAHAGAPDVGTGAVAFDERDDRIVGNGDLSRARVIAVPSVGGLRCVNCGMSRP